MNATDSVRSIVENGIVQLLNDCNGISEWQMADTELLLDYLTSIFELTPGDDDDEDIIETLRATLPLLENVESSIIIKSIHAIRTNLLSVEQKCANRRQKAVSLDLGIDEETLLRRTVSSSSSTDTPIDEDVKSAIITKHSMSVESTEPCNPSLKLRPTEQKGNLRYLNNEIVSTKGGRHLERKKDESDEMKKTYINLKPLKQYRFH